MAESESHSVSSLNPREVIKQLIGVPIEIELTRNGDNYSGETALVAKDGLTDRSIFELRKKDTISDLELTVNGSFFGDVELEEGINKRIKIKYVQTERDPSSLQIQEIHRGKIKTKKDVPLIETDPLLYLAQCLERHLGREGILTEENRICFYDDSLFGFDKTIDYRSAQSAIGASNSVSAFMFRKKNFDPDANWSEGINTIELLKYWLYPSEKHHSRKLDDEELAELFGATIEDIKQLNRISTFTAECYYEASIRKKQKQMFFDAIDKIIQAKKSGKTLLDSTTVIEANEKEDEDVPEPVSDETIDKIVAMYQLRFNLRATKQYIGNKVISGNNIVVNPETKRTFPATSTITLDELSQCYEREVSEIKSLARQAGFGNKNALTPFEALVMFNRSTKEPHRGRPSDYVEFEGVYDTLLIDPVQDTDVLEAMKEKGMLKEGTATNYGEIMYGNYKRIYERLDTGWASTMSDGTKGRKEIMSRLGYLEMPAIIFELQKRGIRVDVARTEMGKLRSSIVLGTVHQNRVNDLAKQILSTAR